MARLALCIILGCVMINGLESSTALAQVPPILSEQELVLRVNDPMQLIAIVGDQPILAGDLLPTVDQMLSDSADKVKRAVGVQQLLARKIEVKLIYLDFLRSIPPDKLEVAQEGFTQQIDEQFYEQQVKVIMKNLKANSLSELEEKLRSLGSSIERQKSDYREQAISQYQIGQQVDQDPEITHDQLWSHYEANWDSYDVPARARWEKLTARFDRFATREEADMAICEMGNQVLRGAKFASVAKELSQGTNAADGGYHDWTTAGSLVSEVLDRAIFTLELNKLSGKLEDDRGFHIIRVLERQDASRVSFTEAQADIRKELQDAEQSRQLREYIARLRKGTHVWTIFDALIARTSETRLR